MEKKILVIHDDDPGDSLFKRIQEIAKRYGAEQKIAEGGMKEISVKSLTTKVAEKLPLLD